ncbi:MAG: hypothetical protein P8Q20_02135, partial [Acidimicrobiales bacterium]|nr:hypothetical protein [Acidimicrobiales bacterium]
PHESQWSLEWQASDPNALDGIPESGNLPSGGAETVNCPPPDSFAPTAEVAELACSAPPPHVVTVLLDNTESTVGAAFTVVSNIDGTDNTEYDGTVEAGSVDTVSIPIPEDADWSVSWAASDNRDLSDSVEGREPLIFVNTADCTDPPPPVVVGNVYGYVWVDWDKSGTRTGIEDGVEEHVTGAVATLTNTTDYLDETGQLLHGPGGYVRTAITGDGGKGGSDVGDYRWFIADVPVEDNSGNTQEYKVLVDYADATFPSGFVPSGYTVKNNDNVLADEMDSDVAPLAGSIGESAPFALVENLDEHRVDAGVVTDIAFEPTAVVTVDCDSGTAQITLDNTLSAVDANFTVDAWAGTRSDANRLDGSGAQVVIGGSSSDYDQTITTPAGQVLLIRVTAMAWEDGQDLGLGSLQAWDQSISDAPARFCPSIQVIATDCPPTLILDNTQSEVDVTYLLTTVIDGVDGEEDHERVGLLATKSVELSSLVEGSTWYLKWVIEDPDDSGRRYEGLIPAPSGTQVNQFTVDCEPPLFEPVVELVTACSYADYGYFALATGVMEVRVDNSASDVGAVVRIFVDGFLRESTTVAAGEVSGTLESPGVHGDVFTVEVSAGTNTHLYNLKAKSTTLDCPTVSVQVVSDEVDCTSNSPTITVTFTNNSDTAIDLGFWTQLNPPAGSGEKKLLVTQTQRVFLPADGEETQTFGLKKNWTFSLTWSAETLGTETEFTASGQFPDSSVGPSVYCPTEDSVFEPVVEITAQCTATGTIVTVTVDNTGSEVDAVATWTYAGGEGPGADEEIVPAGDVFEHEEEAAHDETWIVSVRADAAEGDYSGESPIKANVKVDCPRPTLFLYTECADGKLNVEIDNSDFEFFATLTVTEFLSGGEEGRVVYGPETVTAGVETTVPIDFASGATYTATLTGQGDAYYQ